MSSVYGRFQRGSFAVASHFFPSASNSSVVMPVSVTRMIFSRSRTGSLAIASRFPDSTVLKGSSFFNSGYCSANTGTRRGSASFDYRQGAPPKARHPDRRWQYALQGAQILGCPVPWCLGRNRGLPALLVLRSTRAVRRSTRFGMLVVAIWHSPSCRLLCR